MRVEVHHRTVYRYSRPVTLQPHRLLLFPRGGRELSVVSMALDCRPSAALTWTQDVFGNLIATATFASPADELVITSDLAVEQSALAWPVFAIAPHAHHYPFAYAADELTDLGALLTPEHADPDDVLGVWAHALARETPIDTLSLLKGINASLLDRIAYRARDAEGTQTPLQTLAVESGSCRDLAALFIEGVRRLGFAARAVSGYLFDPNAPPAGENSTHAWAEVYLPQAGWIAFDPTHGRVGDAGLIPVAVGRNNGQIMPVTGGYAGAPEDFLAMSVEVDVVGLGPVTSQEGGKAAPGQVSREEDRPSRPSPETSTPGS